MRKDKKILKDAFLKAVRNAQLKKADLNTTTAAAEESEAYHNDADVVTGKVEGPKVDEGYYSNWNDYKTRNSNLVTLENGKRIPQWQLEETVRRSIGNYSPLGNPPGGRNANEPAIHVLNTTLNMHDKTQAARQDILERFPDKWPAMGDLEKMVKMPLPFNKRMLYNWTGGKPNDRGGLLHAKAGAGKTTAFNDYYPYLAAGHALTHKYLWWTAPKNTVLTPAALREYPIKEKRYIVGAPADISGWGSGSSGVGEQGRLWNAVHDLVDAENGGSNDNTINFVFDEFYTLLQQSSSSEFGRTGIQQLISFLKDAFGSDNPKFLCRFFGLYATNDKEAMDRLLGPPPAGLGFFEGQMARRIGKSPMYEIPWSAAEGWAQANLVGRPFAVKDSNASAISGSDLDDEAAAAFAKTNAEISKLMAQKARAIFYRPNLPEADVNPQQTSVQAALVILWGEVKNSFRERVESKKYKQFIANDELIKRYEDTKEYYLKKIASIQTEIQKLGDELGDAGSSRPTSGPSVIQDAPDVLASISYREVTAVERKPRPSDTQAPLAPPAPATPATPAAPQQPQAPSPSMAPDTIEVENRVNRSILENLKKNKADLEKRIEAMDKEITRMDSENIKIKNEIRASLQKPLSQTIKGTVIQSTGDYIAPDLSDFRTVKKRDVIDADASKAQQAFDAMQAQAEGRRAGGNQEPAVLFQPETKEE
jgi:hypothetical protein